MIVGYHQRSHWDAVHAVTVEPDGEAALAVARSAVGALGSAPGAVVVDVACGTGPFLRVLPGDVTGVGVDLAHGALRPGGVCGDALALPLLDGVADAVTVLSSWWALPDVDRAVREGTRVLRPGGTLLVHTWDRAPTCRLITLGAVCIAKVLPSMVRPEGVRGPFDVPVSEVATVLGAGLEVRGTVRLEHTWPLGTVAAYWTEFGPLAPTSYAAYLDAPDHARATVDRLLGGLLDRLRSEGVAGLGLTWHLTAAVKP
ncbi:MAG: methyltransferase domain-containing protein [Saccharothrix sp.]|nr:methyltransferase domain-containing protein [Saccharothrix sp.]